MNTVSYKIDIKKLGVEPKFFEYNLDDQFFKKFENSSFEKGEAHIQVIMDKRGQTIVADFECKGYINTLCDRCNAGIDLPIHGHETWIFKLSVEEWDDEEAITLPMDSDYIEMDQYLYEVALLAIPMVKTYDCEEDESVPCNQEILNKLEDLELKDEGSHPLKDQLKNLKL